MEPNVSNLATTSSSVASDSSESSTNSCDTSEDSSWEDKGAPSTSTIKHNPMVSKGGLLQAQSYQPIEQQGCAVSFLVKALKYQPQVSKASIRLSSRERLK